MQVSVDYVILYLIHDYNIIPLPQIQAYMDCAGMYSTYEEWEPCAGVTVTLHVAEPTIVTSSHTQCK